MNTHEQILLLNYGAGKADQLPQATINFVQIYIVVTEQKATFDSYNTIFPIGIHLVNQLLVTMVADYKENFINK